MSFARFFRKKTPDPDKSVQINASKLKVAQSLDSVQNYMSQTSLDQLSNGTLGNGTMDLHENQMDDVSVHSASVKYSSLVERRSQLFKSLKETLEDKDALACFFQFLESKGQSHLLKFCLDVHSFKVSFALRLSRHHYKIIHDLYPHDNEEQETEDYQIVKIREKDEMKMDVLCEELKNEQQFLSVPTYYLSQEHDHKVISGCPSIEKNLNIESAKRKNQEAAWSDIEEDVLSIFNKYFTANSRHHINPPDDIGNRVVLLVSRCHEDREAATHCYEECEKYVYDILENTYYPQYLQSPYHCKHQLDILTSNSLTISDVIYHDTSLSYFTEFMEQNKYMDYLQCFLDVDNFHRHLSSQECGYDAILAQEDAMIIYDKFISMQASRPLNFSGGVRFEVEGSICKEGGPLPDCFLLPRSLLLYKIEQVHFPIFLKSDLYYKYLVDLINTVHNSRDIPGYRRIRKGSDASSEKSLETISTNSISSTQNTLLAMDTRGKLNSKKKLGGEDMRIDSSLLDPGNLWHRPNTGMKLGHVNGLGQFIPEFEPEPDHQKKKFSFPFSKKNVQSDEEMIAVQAAQQILQEVNILTNNANISDYDDACFM